MLRHLLRRAGDAPVLVVAISRDHDVEPGNVLGDVVHALDREGWVRRLPLRGLDESDVRALIQQSEEGPTDAPVSRSRRACRTWSRPASLASAAPRSTWCGRPP
jgi:hypothetical protein